jgi:hypothetical protein
MDLTNRSKSEFTMHCTELPIWSCALPSYTLNLLEIQLLDVEKIRINPDEILPVFAEGEEFLIEN